MAEGEGAGPVDEPERVRAPIAGGQPRGSPVERLIVLILGVVLALALVYIVIAEVPIGGERYAVVRVLLALAAAAVGAFLPGAFMEIEGNVRGFSIRAAGALALFVLVFYGSERVDDAPLDLLPISTPDLRTSAVDQAGRPRADAPVTLVLPVGFKRGGEVPEVTILGMEASVRYTGGELRLRPLHLTQLSQNVPSGPWLPNFGDLILPLTIPADGGGVEFAFYPAGTPTRWGPFAQTLAGSDTGTLKVHLEVDTNLGHVERECAVDFPVYAKTIRDALQSTGLPPKRLSMRC